MAPAPDARPDVSVIIPAYNAEPFILETVTSVLEQRWAGLEVIVVDDGSTDRTAELVNGLADPRLRVESIRNGGQAAARNHGLSLTSGRAVCFLDADDIWFPDKLTAQLPLLGEGDSAGGVVVVGCPFRYVTARGRLFGLTGDDPATAVNREKIRRGELLPFPLSAALISRSALERAGAFDASMHPAEDLDLYTRLAQHGEFRWVDRCLGAYRVHPDSDSVDTVRRQRRTARFLMDRTAARALGQPDPPRPDFSAGAEEFTREDAAALQFRKAAVLAVSGSPGPAALAMAQAARLSPGYILRRGSKRLLGALAARRMPTANPSTAHEGARTDILGVRVSAVDQAMAVDVIAGAVTGGTGGYVCVTGVHGVMESQRDPSLVAVHNDSLLTVPDGMPMVWLSNRAGADWVTRVYGPDLMIAVLHRAAREGWSSYLYGGAAGVPEALGLALAEKVPGYVPAGGYSPPYRDLTPAEEDDIVKSIRAAGPALVWVGLSTPKQERWMARMAPRLPGVVCLGVGAAFDFHIGRVAQAPPWMQQRGLEWLFRLVVEPRRLWRRYLINNPAFILAIARRKPRLVP